MRIRTQLKEIASFAKGSQINGDDLIENGEYDYLNGGITPSGKWNAYNTPGRTVTISEGGNSCGYVNYMRKPFWCGAHCYYLFDTINNTEYLYYMLKSQQDRLMKLRSGACMPNIKKADLGSFELEYEADTDKQQHVVSILERVEGIITARKQQLSALDDLIKARFVEMFGDPVINDRDWKQITLLESLEAGRTVTYGIVQTGDEFENGTPVFRPIDIAGGHMPKREELKKTDPLISAQYKRTLLKGNELLITVRGSIGETFQTADEFEGCNVGRNIVPLVTDSNKVLQRFLQELFAQDAIKNWLKGITKGIALQGLNMGEFKEMPVIVPPIAMQRAFVGFASQIDKSKSVIRKSLDETQFLFDSLMQKYFG